MNQEQQEKKKEMLYELLTDKNYRPMKAKEIAGLLMVPKEGREELKQLLDVLLHEGKAELDEKGCYQAAGANIVTGTYSGTNRGFGFVTVEGEKEDIFIPEVEANSALDKDVVRIAIRQGQNGRRREGTVLEVLERASDELVGTFQKGKSFSFVVPDNQKFSCDVFIPREKTGGAVNGHKVLVKLTDFGDDKKNPEGEVTKILGHINDPGVDVMSVIYAYSLPMQYPEEVLAQAEAAPDTIDAKDWKGRMDLTMLPTVTIDGEDAKDLDDAITLSFEDGIYHLGVHIADVSEYVTEGSPLDKEALKRGTSVYLVDRVIPMLPHKLSNGICSLNAGCDRLALSCMMDVNTKGEIISHKIAETVIRVDKRMTYTAVKQIVEDHEEEVCKTYQDFVPMFEMMNELAAILREKRRKRGSIDFDFPECKMILDETGKPTEIKPYDRNCATKMIEDFMLAANETVAEDYFWQELPFVYRTHENPDAEKIQKLGIFINNFGYSIKVTKDEIHPKELQKLLVKVDGTPEEALISRLCLRSMKQAKYTTFCDGHFGLAAKYYCHFTSPIRRYPDLQIHRIIKENLRGKLKEKRVAHYESILNEVAAAASRTERRAEEAEREVLKLKKVEFVEDKIGEIFEGVVSGVTSWGMFVELPNTVEGMIRLADLKEDYYVFDEEHYQLIGEHTKKSYKLGQTIRVQIVSADKILKTIDMIPV